MTNHDEREQEAPKMRHHSRMVDAGAEAFQATLARTRNAMEAARAAIDVTFGPRNNAVKRLAHQMIELGTSHLLIRLSYRKYARALAPAGCDPASIEVAILVFHAQWAANLKEARNTELGSYFRQTAGSRAARYRAILLVLRYLRLHGTTPARFEALRADLAEGCPQ